MGKLTSWGLVKYIDDNLICNASYDLIRGDRKDKRGGGLCFYVNKTLSYEKVEDSITDLDCELLSWTVNYYLKTS